MARGTWYRYSKILGLSKKTNQYKKKHKRISIRANIPSIWLWMLNIIINDGSTQKVVE